MDEQISVAPLVNSSQEWQEEMDRLASKEGPSFFHLRTRLPESGRTNQVLAATPNMSVVLKTYASGGENELHAHTNEDHVFVVLQGCATFFGPRGEVRKVRSRGCVLLPKGALYRFSADEEGEALVMLRIGATVDGTKDVLARVDEHGGVFDGYANADRHAPIVLSDRWFA